MAFPTTSDALNNWKVQVRHLKEGMRWCIACGVVRIEADAPKWSIRCIECYKEFKETKGEKGDSKYCKKCGNELEQRRIEWARTQSKGKRECVFCYFCSKDQKESIAPGIYVPDHWMPYAPYLLSE